jgi:dTDP-4-amino-4,6-dideoxygalactose transaminase
MPGAFRAAHIDAQSCFHPLSTQPWLQRAAITHVSRDIASRAINLQAYYDLNDEQQRVIATVRAMAPRDGDSV